MYPTNIPIWTSVARAILTAIGGVLVAMGWTDEGTVELIIGAAMTVLGALWGVNEKLGIVAQVEKKDRKIDVLQGDVNRKEAQIGNLEEKVSKGY